MALIVVSALTLAAGLGLCVAALAQLFGGWWAALAAGLVLVYAAYLISVRVEARTVSVDLTGERR